MDEELECLGDAKMIPCGGTKRGLVGLADDVLLFFVPRRVESDPGEAQGQ